MTEREAMLYEKLAGDAVGCGLCAHRCIIQAGRVGVCGVRLNDGGTLRTLVYGRVVSQGLDPIEKKPLFHFYPGSTAYSIATVGCNFRCRFCQNAEISQTPRDDDRIMGDSCTPEQIVRAAVRCGARSISYTYTEPTIFA
ncbi:MAG: radical SAM protein, partial [Chloroflexi bacterium]|nr:radical SAM protein [Chloroflexota bacterium]